MTTDVNVPKTRLYSLTHSAKERIRYLCRFRFEKDGNVSIPAVICIDSVLNEGRIKSHIAIAFYDLDKREEIKNDLQVVDGLELVLAIPDEEHERFHGKILDYNESEFLIFEPSASDKSIANRSILCALQMYLA